MSGAHLPLTGIQLLSSRDRMSWPWLIMAHLVMSSDAQEAPSRCARECEHEKGVAVVANRFNCQMGLLPIKTARR